KIRSSGDPAGILTKGDEYYAKEDYQRAQALYELVLPTYRGRKEAEEIAYRYAYTYYYMGQYILASYYFNNFAQTFGGSSKKEEADFMSAYCNYKLSPTFRLDQTYTDKAIEDFQLFINTYPQSTRVEECNKLIDEMRAKLEDKAYHEALLYFDMQYYQSAIQTFDNMLKDFPETSDAEQVRYMILRSAHLLAENSFVDKQQERYIDARDRAQEFINRFPESKNLKEVKDILANANKKLNQLNNVRHQSQSSGN
ncbi:MAG TPA: outer membrane protein assembly factor BamD, partial [Flavilitoribacter sp.]|nr:outer membrane protein assembly factor BamD [Flavilitoribacter sp.]